MTNFLIEYFNRRHQDELEVPKKTGPLVTISREFGCQAKSISRMLVERLNTYHQEIGAKQEWQLISKEILELSAKELETESRQIEYIFNFEKRSSIDDFLLSISHNQYQSNWKVKRAIRNAVLAIAQEGKAVIVGRAAAQITRLCENALHVRLVAPHDWRVQQVMQIYQTSNKLAEKKVKEMDHNRQKLIHMFAADADCDYCYDVYYNMKNLQPREVVLDMIHMMQQKKLI